MSVIGLVIALGMLIDNAIVVVDEINTLLAKGDRPKAAITKSLNYLAIPLLASTITTVLTFLPDYSVTWRYGRVCARYWLKRNCSDG